MRKFLILTGMSAVGLASFAQTSEPTVIEDALIHSLSPNGKYAVSFGTAGMRIFDLETGEEFTQPSDFGYELYDPGLTKCVSNDGVVIASDMTDESAVYRKGGEWHYLLGLEGVSLSNYPQAITADGSRICGTVGLAPTSYDEDSLMQGPCVWNAEGDGYGSPVLLPHPDRDFLGNVPQYITAIDMSEDGKTIIGQIRDSYGLFNYPIVYREDANGDWSYEIPHADLMNPDNLEIIPFPGVGPVMPQYETFMTQEEIDAYKEVYQNWIISGCVDPYPEYYEFMTPEEIAEYNKAADEYNALATVYNEKLDAWSTCLDTIMASSPGYEFNAVHISPDGKTYGSTIVTESEDDGFGWVRSYDRSVWLFELDSDRIFKYEKDEDLNLYYIANDGIALATTLAGSVSQSNVLQNGEVISMESWMGSKAPAYSSWMDENMVFPFENYVWNEELGYYDVVYEEVLMTGRATSTPDLSVVALSVQNVWDEMDDGNAYIFDMKVGTGVESVTPAIDGQVIYDLSGRKLNSANAPGIYIINGEKKVVR